LEANDLQETTAGPPPQAVITSRRLKSYLESRVPVVAGAINIQLRQQPEVRVETALPKYFGIAPPRPVVELDITVKGPFRKLDPGYGKNSTRIIDEAVAGRRQAQEQEREYQEIERFAREVAKLQGARGRTHFETRTGFTVIGAGLQQATAQDWDAGLPFVDEQDAQTFHVRLTARSNMVNSSASVLLEFDNGGGILLAILPDFIGTVVVEENRVLSVNYVPSDNSPRYASYLARAPQLEAMKAKAAVASRQGQFTINVEEAALLADQMRQFKSIDPTMGLYAAYSYAQGGKYKEVANVLYYLSQEHDLPVVFDVAMLAARYQEQHTVRIAPFAPMLSQGWSVLLPDHPMHRPMHDQLRVHLVPSLWTTYTARGVEIIREMLLTPAAR
jgi:hypothetical protein